MWVDMCQWHGIVYSMNICVNDTDLYILWIYLCQWHGLVYSVNIYVSMTQTSIGCELICANDTVSYIRWIYVSMTQICIFYEYICVSMTRNGYSVNICVSMTRNGIIRQCRKIDQVLFLLFVTVYANHTMYGWFRWSFAMQKCPQWGEIRWSSVYRGSWLPWTKLMSRSPVLSNAHHKNWFYNI